MSPKSKLIAFFLLGFVLGGVVHHNYKSVPKKIKAWAEQRAKERAEFAKLPDVVWTMVNVSTAHKQGDAHLIQSKGEENILIDAGFLAPATNSLVPLLQSKKIEMLDLVVISHPHKDHYQGVKAVLEAGIKIKSYIFHTPDKVFCDREIPWGCDYPDIVDYKKMLARSGAEEIKAKAGQVFDLGNDTTLKTLYAFDVATLPPTIKGINDLSLIMKLEVGDSSVLFTGDLNTSLGTWLADNGKGLESDILKVPHHGTASLAPASFFDAVAPKAAFVPSPWRLWCSDRSN